jgi:hypothetical protein
VREGVVDVYVTPGTVVQAPNDGADFIFSFARDDIQTFERMGDDLFIALNDGSTVIIQGFYIHSFDNALVFRDELETTTSTSGLLVGALGLGGAVGGAALASSGGGGSSTAPSITIDDTGGGEDGIISSDEHSNGITISGTAEPGAIVTVTIGTESENATADADGNWAVEFAQDQLPEGQDTITINVSAVNPDGSVSIITETVILDTVVSHLTLDELPGGADRTLNIAEAASGVTLTGTVEPGSTVVLEFNGSTYTANVDANGNWTVDIPLADIPDSDGGTFELEITATDSVGNTDTITETFQVDTQAPSLPDVVGRGGGIGGYNTVTIQPPTDGEISFAQIDQSSDLASVAITDANTSITNGTTQYFLAEAVSNLIISVADTAENTSSSFYVFEDGGANVTTRLDNVALTDLNIHSINLEWEEVDLELTEQAVAALANDTNTVIVRGDANDTITMLAASLQGQVTDSHGESYMEYSLGSTTIWIDDDIPTSNIIT